MLAYWCENLSMPAGILKMYPAKYHPSLSHCHKENIQKYIILYNSDDIMLLINAYPDSHLSFFNAFRLLSYI